MQFFLGLRGGDANSRGQSSVVLFSGGLDSLAGAVQELRTNRHVVLLSHRNNALPGARQGEMAAKLAAAYPDRVTHVSVGNSLTKKLPDLEHTQRTRSVFFAAMAAVAAQIEGADRIRFYENGFMSVNLPIATQVVGWRASRTTHPRTLNLLGGLLNLVNDKPIEVDNPFIWKTKVEVVRELASSPHASLITRSLSCSKTRFGNKNFKPHCGTCIQCLQRRISTVGSGAGELDDASGYEVDLFHDPRQDGRDRVMAVGSLNLALDCADVSDSQFAGMFAGPVAGCLQACAPAERSTMAQKLADLFRRHGQSVRRMVIEEAAKRLPDVLDRKASPDSLLAIVLKSRLDSDRSPRMVVQAVPILPEVREEAGTPREEILVAVDTSLQRILICDRPDLKGKTIFPIMRFLIEASKEDRQKDLAPENYRSFPAKVLANRLSLTDDEAVRSAVKQARDTLEKAEKKLLGTQCDRNAVIQSKGNGYRLNPHAVVASPEQLH